MVSKLYLNLRNINGGHISISEFQVILIFNFYVSVWFIYLFYNERSQK